MSDLREIDKCCQTMCNKHQVIKEIEGLEADKQKLTQLIAIFWREHGPHDAATDAEAIDCSGLPLPS